MAFSNDNSMSHHLDHHTSHPITTVYKECLRNRMVTSGGYLLDGCSEFMPSSTIIPGGPRTLNCAFCGCHRNFHRCELKEASISQVAHHAPEYQPHHHNHPPSPPSHHTTNFASPQPISIYPSIPHMVRTNDAPENVITPTSTHHTSAKHRTKFTWWQKEKMYEFSKNVGWKIKNLDKEVVMEFCNEIGVSNKVLKVWMSNNKNTFGKRYDVNVNNGSNGVNGNDNDNLN